MKRMLNSLYTTFVGHANFYGVFDVLSDVYTFFMVYQKMDPFTVGGRALNRTPQVNPKTLQRKRVNQDEIIENINPSSSIGLKYLEIMTMLLNLILPMIIIIGIMLFALKSKLCYS